jgi:two-component system response regulator YesN
MTKELCVKVGEFVISRNDQELKHLNISQIANYFGVKPSYLSRIFKSSMRFDLKLFITKEKMYRAFLLCRNGNGNSITYKEIAKKIGFKNPHYFKRLFREHFGIYPEEYLNYQRGGFPPHEFN